MFTNSPKTNSPTQYKTNNNYSTTFTGPITPDARLQDSSRNQAMAQAAYQGDQRQYNQQQGKGIGAGGKMGAYRSGVQADTEAAKGYAQAQQDMLTKFSDSASSDLQFQERLAGEKGWVRDLILGRDQTLNRERMAAYKRFVDVNLSDYERMIKEAVAAKARQTTILGGLI
jgi:hypothetical protein